MKRILTYSFLAISAFISCEKACDDILLRHHITIVDQDGNPLSGIDLNIINTRTGKPLCSEIAHEDSRKNCENELNESPPDSGIYAIVSSLNDDVKDGDVIEVSGSISETEFSAQYTVHTNQCNLEKVFGPEVIVVEIE